MEASLSDSPIAAAALLVSYATMVPPKPRKQAPDFMPAPQSCRPMVAEQR
jgi:hypothetical protein